VHVARPELIVNRSLRIPHAELELTFSASGGPGGQHANRSNTRVELRWDVTGSAAVSEHQRRLITERLGDEVRVVADDERSQRRNRALAEQRLVERVQQALHEEKPRTATRPTKASKRRRAEAKQARSQVKQNRRRPGADG
jgi:ribosome-associated protein